MKAKLIQFLYWLLSLLEEPVEDVIALRSYQAVTEKLVNEWKDNTASGEYKRHQVLSKLIKLYPDARIKDLALEIEFACQDLD